MTIGQRLQQARKQRGFTQLQVAAQLHVARQTISSWETGHSYPDVASLVALSDLLHISSDSLLKSDAAMLAEFSRQATSLKRVKRLSHLALAINLLLAGASFATALDLPGFDIAPGWQLVIAVVLGLNAVPLFTNTTWVNQLQHRPPIPHFIVWWFLGDIGGGLLIGVPLGIAVGFGHLAWFWLLIAAFAYVAVVIVLFWRFARHHPYFQH